MADLTEITATQSIKIVGSSTTAVETTPVNASPNGDLFVRDILNIAVVQTLLSVSTTATECKVGGSTLSNRKILMIQVQGSGYTYGFASGSQPFDIANGSTLMLAVGPSISVWVKKASGTANVAVAELS